MSIILPLSRTTRAITACTFLPDNPVLAIASSEIISYVIPFINNSPINALNDMILFIFYYYNYNHSANLIINQYKKKYINNYTLENLLIIIYLLNYFLL